MIEVKNLVKKYGHNTAVDDISFTVNPGEILGFLGSNGAGKTTTMNIMTGFISATSGDVLINGMDILDEPEKVKKSIGYLPDIPPLYLDLTVEEYLNFVYDLKKLPKNNKKEAVENIMEQVQITDMRKRLTKNLSKGYRQRAGLAQAMLGNPEILILDEPTSGLDPKQIIEMRQVIKNLSTNHTIILSSHILSEVSAVCDRVMIIDKGKMVAMDTPENLGNHLNDSSEISVRISGDIDLAIDKLNELADIEKVINNGSFEEGTIDLIVDGVGNTDIRTIVSRTLFANGIEIYMLKPRDVSLENIFMSITNQEEKQENKEEIEEVEVDEEYLKSIALEEVDSYEVEDNDSDDSDDAGEGDE